MSSAAVSKSGVKPFIYPSHEVPRNPQAFFKKVYTHITDDRDLPKALALIKMGNAAIHTGLTDKNKKMIAEWVEKGSNPSKQAFRLVSILKGHSEIFSGVDPEKFSESSEAAGSSSSEKNAESKKEKKADSDPKDIGNDASTAASLSLSSSSSSSKKSYLEKVKELGRASGLTEAQVNEALEEVTLPDGNVVWMIKTSHTIPLIQGDVSDPFKAWEFALIKLAANKKIGFFAEGHIRADRDEKLVCTLLGIAASGYFRGLETEASQIRLTVLAAYQAIIRMKNPLLYNRKLLEVNLKSIFMDGLTRTFAVDAITEATLTSKTAKIVDSKLTHVANLARMSRNQFNMGPHIDLFATLLVDENPDISKWVDFVETLLPIVYKESPPEVVAAIKAMVSKEKALDISKATAEMEETSKALLADVIAKIRGPRDIDYSKMFLGERPSLPKDKQAFVMLGANHAPGFKAAVTGGDPSKADGKKKDDDKKRS